MKLEINIKDKLYRIELTEEKGKIKIKVNEKEFVFEQPRSEQAKRDRGLAETHILEKRDFSQKEIKAPIAGIISQIFVKEKEKIKKGQKLLVLSAMKMENEIVADRSGQIKKILVKEKQKVKDNDPLLVMV